MKELRKRRITGVQSMLELKQAVPHLSQTLEKAVTKFKMPLFKKAQPSSKNLSGRDAKNSLALYKMCQALQLIINYGDKVINQGHIEDPKCTSRLPPARFR